MSRFLFGIFLADHDFQNRQIFAVLEKVGTSVRQPTLHFHALDSSKSTSWAFLTSLRMRGKLPVDTAKIANVTAICMSDLMPMIITPRGLTVYRYGVRLWSARVNVLKARSPTVFKTKTI